MSTLNFILRHSCGGGRARELGNGVVDVGCACIVVVGCEGVAEDAEKEVGLIIVCFREVVALCVEDVFQCEGVDI